jgi:uncharacterized protein (TIGR03382 family)
MPELHCCTIHLGCTAAYDGAAALLPLALATLLLVVLRAYHALAALLRGMSKLMLSPSRAYSLVRSSDIVELTPDSCCSNRLAKAAAAAVQ